MSPAQESSLGIVAYLALFTIVGLLFLFANLLLGRFLRPHDPHAEKQEIYECGEPTIGSSFVQFDLRFYVVALLFIIFDVEVAFFFPWATVFGKSVNMAKQEAVQKGSMIGGDETNPQLTAQAKQFYRELGVRNPQVPTTVPATLAHNKKVIEAGSNKKKTAVAVMSEGAKQFALVTILDIIIFFAILLIGYAYVWRRGDLDWVRAVSRERSTRRTGGAPSSAEQQSVVTA